MKKELMRYWIKSGMMLEKRDVLLPVGREKRAKRGKYTGRTLAEQIERNKRASILELNRVLCCNFRRGDLRLTLNFPDGELPGSLDEVHRRVGKMLHNLTRAYTRRTGKKLRWVVVPADTDPDTGERVRLHCHVWLSAVEEDFIWRYWPRAYCYIDHVDGRRDHIAAAVYLVNNTGYKRGRRNWSTSQGMLQPEYSAPVRVKQMGNFQAPRGAVIVDRAWTDDETGLPTAYMRCVLPGGEGYGNMEDERRRAPLARGGFPDRKHGGVEARVRAGTYSGEKREGKQGAEVQDAAQREKKL